MKFWMTMFNVVIGSIMGGIIAAFNGGTKMEGILLAFMFIIWFEVRDTDLKP
jgi:hypothetical protein